MNKKEFLSDLDRYLRKLPTNEREDIIQDYNEYFTFGAEEGKTENQIVESLGSPKQLSKELLANYHIEKMTTTSSTGNMFRAVWAVIGLGFVNLSLVLGPFLGLIGLLAGCWIAGVAGMVSPLLVIASSIANPGTFEWFDLFVSIAFCGIGLFILIGMKYATLAVKNGVLRYLKYNVAIVKGGIQHG